MLEKITRYMAGYRASNLSVAEVQLFTGISDLDSTQAEMWVNGLSSYIETAYNDERKLFIEIIADYNRNRSRRFLDADGNTVDYYRVTDNYLIYMCRPANARKKYTLNNFNAYVKANYTEI